MNTTKQFRRTRAQFDQDEQILIARLDAGGCPKQVADELGISLYSVYRQVRVLGYRAMFVRKGMLKNPAAFPYQ